jgi:hypothetical protein
MKADYLSNLPKSDSNDELEDISFAAFDSLLPKDKFQLRDERFKDKGVDASIEAKTNGLSTNFRAQIQLKGTRNIETKKDGSVAFSVKTSNLNYLLNYPISLYILYIEPRNEFRFVWASDELKRLTQENPEWVNQTEITLNFKEVLDSEKLDQIHDLIIRQGAFGRSINNNLLLSNAASVVLEIDSSSLEVNDSNKIKELLIENGLAYIGYGYAETVLDKIGLLNSADKELPEIQVLAAHAEYDLGRYPVAKSILARLRFQTKSIPDKDFLMASYLELCCDYQTGRIDIQKYTDELKELAQSETPKNFPLKLRLCYLKQAILVEKDVAQRRKLLEEFRGEIEKYTPENSIKEVDLHNWLQLLEAEGQQISLEFSYEANRIILKDALGFSSNVIEFYKAHSNKLVDWDKRLLELKQKTKREALIADILTLRASILIFWVSAQKIMSKYLQMEFENAGLFKEIKANLANAIAVYSKRKLIEFELKAKNLLADVLNFEKKFAEANAITSNVSKLANDFDYANVKYLADNPFAKSIISNIERDVKDRDESYINLNDETVHLYAKQRLEALNLPESRLSNVENSIFASRYIVNERLKWCQFIELLADERHKADLLTYFSIDPARVARCRIHPFMSNSANSDWRIVINDFKKTYCENCPDRNPKQQLQKRC